MLDNYFRKKLAFAEKNRVIEIGEIDDVVWDVGEDFD